MDKKQLALRSWMNEQNIHPVFVGKTLEPKKREKKPRKRKRTWADFLVTCAKKNETTA